ncbi:hypothetical protein FS749_009628 [Ceratobasidium sp. UAMH 11750]|nr:hypothetical protein FS749_009628 [Ceratobasidium sp. UAMH 11750]
MKPIEQLDAQDELVMRLVRAAGSCLSLAPTMPEPTASPVRSLLTLTRFDALPAPPTRTTNLTRLVLSSCIKLPTQALNALLSASPSLTRLEMRALPAVTDETCTILATRCHSLTWLDLGCCPNLGARTLPSILGTNTDGGFKHLRVLHMSGYPHVDTPIFKQLGETLGGTLETLDLAGVWGVTDACLAAFVDMEPSTAQVEMARLTQVERWARARASDDRTEIIPPTPFVSLAARETGLESTLPGPFFRRRTALRHLNLSGCRRVSDTGIGALAHAVPDLETLQLAGIGPIMSPPGLVPLFRTTRKIRGVDFEDANISDSVLEALTTTKTKQRPSHLTSRSKSLCAPIPSTQATRPLTSFFPAAPSSLQARLPKSYAPTIVWSDSLFVPRGLVGAEISTIDTRFVTGGDLPTSSIRPRRGTREWATRGLGYVGARDPNTSDADDECDERNMVVKAYWSWQSVDGLLERRRAALASSGRRNTDVGPSGLGAGPRWGGIDTTSGAGA